MNISFITQLVASKEEAISELEEAVLQNDKATIARLKVFITTLHSELKSAIEKAHV